MGVNFCQQSLSPMTCRLCTASDMPCGKFDPEYAHCALRRASPGWTAAWRAAQKWCRVAADASFGCGPRRNEARACDGGHRRCMVAARLCMRRAVPTLKDWIGASGLDRTAMHGTGVGPKAPTPDRHAKALTPVGSFAWDRSK